MTDLTQYTYEYLLNLALSTVPSDVDKRQGSIIYDALAPACYLLAFAYQEMIGIVNQTYADTATGADLTRRCAERGVNRVPASKAKRLAQFDIDVTLGDRFSINNVTYETVELLTSHQAYLLCETAGSIGNLYFGSLLPVTEGTGVTTATLLDVVVAGEDEESDAVLRARYYANLQSEEFGGNQADYKAFTKALDNIGGCKVYPAWAGGGTVKLVIIDAEYNVPSAGIVSATQDAIDPVASAGEGVGIAPIGHVVTVAAVSGVTTNIVTSVTFASGYVWADVSAEVEAAINAYLLTLKQEWDITTDNVIVVRISQIESAILQVTGIVDVTGTTINGAGSNLILTEVQIPVLGTVTNV